MDLKQRNREDPSIDVSKEAKEKAAKEIFEEHFLGPLVCGYDSRVSSGLNAWETY